MQAEEHSFSALGDLGSLRYSLDENCKGSSRNIGKWSRVQRVGAFLNFLADEIDRDTTRSTNITTITPPSSPE